MREQLIALLSEFCLLPAPSGFEGAVAAALMARLAAVCDHVESDMLGNVCGRLRGTDPSLAPIVAAAHMDRVGFVVSQIKPEGFLQLHMIGGVPEKTVPGQSLSLRLSDGSGWRQAVVGNRCEHLMTETERRTVDTITSVSVDVGAQSAQDARRRGFEIGCPAVYMPFFSPLGDSRVTGTALDNCASLAALVLLADYLSKGPRPQRDVIFAGTVFEEFSQRGAVAVVDRYRPVAFISIDVLLAADTPDVHGEFEGRLGGGPSVSCYNYCNGPFNGTIIHEGLLRLTEQTAVREGIPFQRFVCSSSLGDAAYAQLAGDCPAVMEIGVPIRYAHSPREVADLSDMEMLVRLLDGMIPAIGADFLQARF